MVPSVTVPESISSRLSKFNEYITDLRTYRKESVDQFKEDHLLHHAAERCLQLAIESILDMAGHLIAAKGYREPRDYEDVIAVLQEEKVIPSELAQRLQGLGKFRNLLVHEYVVLDLDQVYQHLFRIEDLEVLAKHLIEAIERI